MQPSLTRTAVSSTLPLNRWLIARGKGPAVVHSLHQNH